MEKDGWKKMGRTGWTKRYKQTLRDKHKQIYSYKDEEGQKMRKDRKGTNKN